MKSLDFARSGADTTPMTNPATQIAKDAAALKAKRQSIKDATRKALAERAFAKATTPEAKAFWSAKIGA